MSDQPLVTIGIPTRNRAGLLAEALQSALNQTYENIEIIVSDNASEDGTANYLNTAIDTRLKRIRQDKVLPMKQNWQCCLQRASGDYFMLLSDDDVLLPTAVESLIGMFEHGKRPEFVYGSVVFVDHTSGDVPSEIVMRGPKQESGLDLIIGLLQWKRAVPLCGALFPTLPLLNSGGFIKGNLDLACDVSAWVRLIHAGSIVRCAPTVVARYSFYSANTTNRTSTQTWVEDLTHLEQLIIRQVCFANAFTKFRIKHLAYAYKFYPILNQAETVGGTLAQRLRTASSLVKFIPLFMASGMPLRVLVPMMRIILSQSAYTGLRRVMRRSR